MRKGDREMNPEDIKPAWTTDGAISVIKNILLRPHARANGKSIMTATVDAALCTAIIALERSKWISVKDKLPEKRQRVLCYFRYEPESPNVICENTFISRDIWLSEGSKVTHWMPLPEEPEETEGEDDKNRNI